MDISENHKAETILLIDAQATRSNVLSSMTRIFNKASAKDIIVLFLVVMDIKVDLWAMMQ